MLFEVLLNVSPVSLLHLLLLRSFLLIASRISSSRRPLSPLSFILFFSSFAALSRFFSSPRNSLLLPPLFLLVSSHNSQTCRLLFFIYLSLHLLSATRKTLSFLGFSSDRSTVEIKVEVRTSRITKFVLVGKSNGV